MAQARNPKLIRMTQLAILLALEAILVFTPIGMIVTPVASITLMHIPVIIGAILLGPLSGGILGGAFGVLAMIRATMGGGAIDMLFNPAASGNPLASIVLSVVPRILLGLFAAYLYILFRKLFKTDYAAIPVSALLATALHTVMVLGLLWLLFREAPAMEGFAVMSIFSSVIALNGLLEMGLAVVLSTAICKPMLKFLGSRKA